MSRTRSLNAVVLRTHDVGEADRFCIFLTAEEGKIAARAAGVRKLTSRMGASLVPFAEVRVMLRESSSGNYVSSAQRIEDGGVLSLSGFGQASEGVELLLRLLQDGEAVPGVFPLTLEFFSACRLDVADAFPRFALRLLHLLGHLPAEESNLLKSLTPEDRTLLRLVIAKDATGLWTDATAISPRIRSLLAVLLADHLSAPLKAGVVGRSLQ
jgi:recombinational DNA repair protein (RecF pathway)